jgi:hypothetical protein
VARREEHPVLELQRSAGNAAVARALLARLGGWHGVGKGSPNAGESTVADKASGKSARRIPIDGIPQGSVKEDLDEVASTETVDKGKDTEHDVQHKVSERTGESAAGGKAIVVIPTGMALEGATVDVLLHLHGHTTGYRKSGGSTRDVAVEEIEQQVASASHPLVAVLPQGGFHSWFGRGGQSFDPTAYLNAVWEILGKLGVWTKPPARGGLILSGHSGADAPMEAMLGSSNAEVAGLKGLFLLDTMYGTGDATRVIAFVKARIARDLDHLASMTDGKAKLAWARSDGFRLRGAHSGGHYAPQMKLLKDAVDAFMADAETVAVLGAAGTPLHDAYAANLVIDDAKGSGTDHDSFVGHGHLKQAVDML